MSSNGFDYFMSLIFYALRQLTFPYNWSWKTSLLLGGLLSATDPVAVVALLKELGASKKLNTIIEGESLMNDGYILLLFFSFFSFKSTIFQISCYTNRL